MAGTKVRGITIELGVDASKITQGLRNANTALSKTNKELKDIDRLLKLDPNNITLLKQRTQALQTQIGNCKDKLKALHDAEQEMKNNGVDENSDQFKALQREIEACNIELDKLEKTEGSGSARLQQFSQVTGQAGEAMTNAGQALMPVTVGIVGLGTAAVKTAADFDTQMSKVQAISGSTGEEMEQLRVKAREMGSTTKFSATEAGEAYEYMAMAGWKTKDMLVGIDGIMDLAAASGTDLATTSDIVTDALTAFGMSADESGHMADVLAAASSNANTNVEMMGESFKYVAPVAGSLGFSVDDVAVALGLMANSGVKASQAGTSLRKLLTNMAKPTKEQAEAMERLGVSLDDGNGNMLSFRDIMVQLREGFKDLNKPTEEQLNDLAELDQELADGVMDQEEYDAAVKEWTESVYGAEGAMKAEAAASLAGQQGMSGLLAIVNASEEDFNKLTGAVDNSAGTAKNMAEVMQDNLEGQLTVLKSQLQELAISFGEIIMPAVQKFVGVLQGLIDKFNALDPKQKEMIVQIAGIVAAVAPALLILGKMATAISAITKVMSTLKFTAFITNPVTLAIGAIAGLVAVIASLIIKQEKAIKACHPFRDELDALKTESDELNRSIEETSAEFEENTNQTQVNAEKAQALQDRLNDLMGVEEKSAEQKAEIKTLVKELNELLPDLNLQYDEQADALNRTNKEIEANIELTRAQAEVDAASNAYSEAIENRIKATQQAEKAQKIYDDTLSQSSEQAKQYAQDVENGVSALELNFKYTAGDIEQGKHLVESKQALTDATETLNEAKSDEADYSAILTKSEKNLTNVTKKSAKEINSINLSKFHDEVKETLGEEFTSELSDAIKNAGKAGVEIPDELKQGLLSGQTSVKDATEQINKAVQAKLAENKSKAEKAGTDTGTGYSNKVLATKEKAMSAGTAVSNSANQGLAKGKTTASTNGTQTGTNYSNKVLAQKEKAFSAGSTLSTQANKGINSTDTAKEKGEKTGARYSSGINSKKGLVYESGQGLSTQAGKGINNQDFAKDKGKTTGDRYASGIDTKKSIAYASGQGLSTQAGKGINNQDYAKDKGKTTGDRYSGGIDAKQTSAYNSGKALSGKANSGLKDNNKGRECGNELAQGYIDGINDLVNDIVAAAAAAAKAAWDAIKSTQKSGSPSKIAIGLGEDFGEGYKIGISNIDSDIAKASAGLANSALGQITNPIVTANRGDLTASASAGNSVTYNQYNTSPRALSASDIYRQTNNLLTMGAR